MDGVEPQRSLEFGQSLLRLVQFEQNRTQKVVRVRVIRIEGRCFLKALQRLRDTPLRCGTKCPAHTRCEDPSGPGPRPVPALLSLPASSAGRSARCRDSPRPGQRRVELVGVGKFGRALSSNCWFIRAVPRLFSFGCFCLLGGGHVRSAHGCRQKQSRTKKKLRQGRYDGEIRACRRILLRTGSDEIHRERIHPRL